MIDSMVAVRFDGSAIKDTVDGTVGSSERLVASSTKAVYRGGIEGVYRGCV